MKHKTRRSCLVTRDVHQVYTEGCTNTVCDRDNLNFFAGSRTAIRRHLRDKDAD